MAANNDPLKIALAQARKGALAAFFLSQQKLKTLITQKQLIDTEIAECQRTLFQMAPVCGIDAKDPITLLGLTDAVRHIIGTSPTPMQITDIMQRLTEARFRLPDSNPLAAVQTVIKRLCENGEIEDAFPHEEGAIWWGWASNAAPPIPPIPDWMIKSQQEIQQENARNTVSTESGSTEIRDDDIPF